MDQLKYEVADELGYFHHQAGNDSAKEYQSALDKKKFEVADDLGIKLNPDYNGDLTTRDAGRIGGQVGGNIGGNMVKKMIAYAEAKLADEYNQQQN